MARPKLKRKYVKSGKYVKPENNVRHIATHNEQPKETEQPKENKTDRNENVVLLKEGIWFPQDFVELKKLGNFMIYIEKGKLINLDKIAKEL